jgi:hypothetical protein
MGRTSCVFYVCRSSSCLDFRVIAPDNLHHALLPRIYVSLKKRIVFFSKTSVLISGVTNKKAEILIFSAKKASNLMLDSQFLLPVQLFYISVNIKFRHPNVIHARVIAGRSSKEIILTILWLRFCSSFECLLLKCIFCLFKCLLHKLHKTVT